MNIYIYLYIKYSSIHIVKPTRCERAYECEPRRLFLNVSSLVSAGLCVIFIVQALCQTASSKLPVVAPTHIQTCPMKTVSSLSSSVRTKNKFVLFVRASAAMPHAAL